ncbi:MAG: hypothetical protein AAF363_14555 [Bacteroidota bacterium]
MEKLLYIVIFASLSFFSCSDDPGLPEIDETVNLIDSLFTSVYVPANGFVDEQKSTRVFDESPVRVIEDEFGNSPDIIFRGLEASERDTAIRVPRFPSDTDQPPTFFESTGAMYLANVESAHYFSDIFEDGRRETPFEYWAVVRVFRTLQQESLFAPGSNMPRLRLRNLSFSEWGINSTEIDYPESEGIPGYLEKTVIRMKYDPPNSQLYYNNVGLGVAPEVTDVVLERIGFGSNGHGQNYELFLLGYIDGVLDDNVASVVYEQIIEGDSEFGALPQLPVAIPTPEDGGDDDVRITFFDRENGRWFLRFNYNAENGVPEDVSRREYQWFWGDARLNGETTNFLNRQHMIPGATDSVLVRSDYARGNNMGNQEIFASDGAACIPDPDGSGRTCFIRVSASIKLYDTNGDSFGEVQTDWLIDNID